MKDIQAPTGREQGSQPEARRSGTGRFVLASVGLHAALLALLSVTVARPPQPIYAEQIYQVALVDAPVPNYQPPVPTHTPKPPEVKPEVKEPPKPPPAPVKDEVKIPETPKQPKRKEPPEKKPEPPKPVEKKPEAAPTPETPPPAKADVPDTPELPVSVGPVDQKDFKQDWYLELVRGIIAREWYQPSGGNGMIRATVHFIIHRDGTLAQPYLMEPSGWSLYDRAALGAVLSVEKQQKLPPLPESYQGETLGLSVVFQMRGGGD